MHAELDLLDWRRRVFKLYAAVRTLPASADRERQAATIAAFRAGRDRLVGGHPQSPLDAAARAGFRGLRHYPLDPQLRYLCPLDAAGADPSDPDDPPGAPARSAPGGRLGLEGIVSLPVSHDEALRFRRIGRVRVPLPGGPVTLSAFRIEGYAGGIFLPFRDATSGLETYGAGRYLWDSVKGADLGSTGGALVIDFNYAYNPSCAYDPRWACPLAPEENRLAVPIRAGELDYWPAG